VSKRGVINVSDLSIAEALEIMESYVGELNDVQNQVIDYLRKFSKIPANKAKELIEKLMRKFGLVRTTAIQIVNIMPDTVEELRVILGLLEKREFGEEELNEMLDLIKSYK